MSTYRLRLLIRLVAHNAESRRAPVPDRLPTKGLNEYAREVLVSDVSALSRALFWLSQALIRISPGLSTDQAFVSATVTPDVTFFVASTEAGIEAVAA